MIESMIVVLPMFLCIVIFFMGFSLIVPWDKIWRYMGVCKKLRDLYANLLFGNTLMIHKNTMRSRFVILSFVNLDPDMPYDT